MKKKISIIIAFIAILAFSIFYGYTDKTHLIYNNDVNTATYTPIGVISEPDILTQNFVSKEDSLTGMSIKCGLTGDHSKAIVHLTVKDAKTGKVLSEGSESGENIKPRKMHKFEIEPISGVKDKELILEVTEENTDAENGIILYYQAGKSDEGTLALNKTDVIDGVFILKTLTHRFDLETCIIIFLSITFVWMFLWFLRRLFTLNDHAKKEAKKLKHNVYLKAPLNRNMGEDMIAEEVMRRYPNTTFHFISSEGYMMRFDSITNCKVYNESSADYKVRTEEAVKKGYSDLNDYLIKTSDAVVKVGNTIFTQFSDDYSAFLNEDRYLAENSKRLFAIGTDFGPYAHEPYFVEYKDIFRKFAGITFRDPSNKERFEGMDNIRFAPDPLFTMRAPLLGKKSAKAIICPVMPINHRGGEHLSEHIEAYADFHARMIRTLLKNGYAVYMFSFSQPEVDDAMIGTVLNKLDENEKQQVYCMPYTHDPFVILKEFSDAEFVIGTRYHSMILGMVYGCKVLPIAFVDRARAMLADINYPYSLTIEEIKEKDINTDEVFEKLRAMEPFNLTDVRARAEKQFSFLDEVLKK